MKCQCGHSSSGHEADSIVFESGEKAKLRLGMCYTKGCECMKFRFSAHRPKFHPARPSGRKGR